MSTNVKINELPSGNFNAKVFDYTDANGKRHYKSITAASKRDVKRLIAEFIATKDEKKASSQDMTVGEAIDKYIEIKSNILSPSTIRGYKKIRNNNLQNLMNIDISDLTQEDVQIEINIEAATHSSKTVRNMHGLLSSALSVYAPSLVLKTTLPQKIKTEIQIPSEEEITQMLNAVKDTDLEIPLHLAAFCGLRASEISALKWGDVDFKKNTLRINKALVLDDEGVYVEKGTKTTAGTRTIRLFSPVANVLKKSNKESEKITTITPQQLKNKFFAMLEKNNIQHYRLHDLRHYTVSVMLSLNIPKNYIADYVGHESERMIDQVYGHIMQSANRDFMDIAEEHFKQIIPNAP